MSYPADLKYTKEHEWIRVDGNTGAIGITDSVKAVSELFAPVSGEVVEINTSLKDRPDHVNSKPHETWMVKVKLGGTGELASLMDAAAYEQLIQK